MDPWTQVYDPTGGALSSALVAGIPLIALFYMLAVRKAKGHHAALTAVICAFLCSVLVWRMPVTIAAGSFLYGVAFGLFPIIWIVITAVWVYNMTVESGDFEYIKSSIARLTDDRRLQAIFIAFSFGSFLEGTAGFGTPVAITAAMLAGLGFSPLYAAGICLLANTAPVAFGAIGVPVIVAGQVSGISDLHISAYVGHQLPLLSVFVPMWLCVAMCGFRRALEVLPAIIVAGLCFAVSQYCFSTFHGPTLPDIMSALCSIVGMVVLLRVWKPAARWRFPDEDPAGAEADDGEEHDLGTTLRVWSPFIILAVMVFLWGLPSFKSLLNSVPGAVISFSWPGVDGLVLRTVPIEARPTVYAAKFTFNWLSAGGTAILLGGFLSVPFMKNYGYGNAFGCLVRTIYVLRFPILTISLILGLAYLMNYSGMTSTLGIAFTMTGAAYPFFSPLLGWLGVFLTGSDTSSNALFCGMQRQAAEVVGMDPTLAVAANSSGGVTGKMISPQSISVACAATGMVGQEGNLFRFALPHSIAMTLIICVLTYLQAGPLHGMMPTF